MKQQNLVARTKTLILNKNMYDGEFFMKLNEMHWIK
jgi:hypothetical protein